MDWVPTIISVTQMLNSSELACEIRKRSQMLLKIKGREALGHANVVLESMDKTGDEDDRLYWFRIVNQVEELIEEKSEILVEENATD